jgi:very-short-patch-repair endonuclease
MARRIIPYNPKLKQLARQLRNNSTLAEVLLWRHLKGRQMLGYDFHRQKPLGTYIVDFFCHELMLAIEVDGSSHNDKLAEDDIRQRELERMGVTVIRFVDFDVKANMNGVVQQIECWIREHTP